MKMLVTLLFFLSSLLHAGVYEINKDHSRVAFKIPYMSFSEVEGAFTEYSGKIDFDPDSEIIKAILGSIVTSSINTLDKKRDNHLRGPDFFYVKKYPSIEFKFFKATKTKPRYYKIEGDLQIRGIKKNIVMDGQYLGKMKDHVGKESIFFKLTTKINRKDFGMIWNKSLDKSEFLVGDLVHIELTLQGQPLGKKSAFSTQQIPSTSALEDLARYRRGEGPRPERTGALPESASALSIPAQPLRTTTDGVVPKESSLAVELVVGFLGFCLLIFLSYLVKVNLIKIFKLKNYSENSIMALVGDGIIISMTLLYSIWYFRYLYP